MLDLKLLKEETESKNRYEKRMAKLDADGRETQQIKHVVETAVKNIRDGQRSFVVYGEPQSGKTEMMIALTAKLLDEKYKIVVVLLNDSVQLLGQNLERFQRSGISPTPKKFSEVLPKNITIGDHSWIIFSKKNARDLEKLILKLGSHKNKVIIDDEADYATPNSKINKQEKSRINELTERLIGEDGIYIGVTATPARLDLNRTHDNQNECWVDFRPHTKYTGQEVFFPSALDNFPYILTPLPDQGDDPKYIRKALFGFMVNVAYLNSEINREPKNYSFLIHTSGKKADHTTDYQEVVKTFEALRDESNTKYEKYYNEIWEIAKDRYPEKDFELVKYILANCDQNNIVVMNSDKEKNAADNRTATDPTAPFTIVIGGNIVSRGVTFNNLLSMFFTRDVKHKMQQDTYIQRARMFGSREPYLDYFELTIPQSLYLNWQKCFIFHRLSLESRRSGKGAPVWLENEKVSAASPSSIHKAQVAIDRGEMSFEIFEYNEGSVKDILDQDVPNLDKIKTISELLGEEKLPKYLIDYIENFMPSKSSIAIHDPQSIMSRESGTDHSNISRPKGFIGDFEIKKFPNAIHHVFILYNDEGKARVFYKYHGNVRFLKTKKHD